MDADGHGWKGFLYLSICGQFRIRLRLAALGNWRLFTANHLKCLCMNYLHATPVFPRQTQSNPVKPSQTINGGVALVHRDPPPPAPVKLAKLNCISMKTLRFLQAWQRELYKRAPLRPSSKVKRPANQG